MRNSFRVGHIFGIDIRIDWSWLLILLLVVWNLSTTRLWELKQTLVESARGGQKRTGGAEQ
ncbi:MAG: hypothetical protein JW918_03475 [Anaerolineae bacterium]|nr:hypothetical protein [Anaerolineae bacterium]